MRFNLSPPTTPVFAISVVLAILALLVTYGSISIPVVSGNAFATLAIAYIILLVGNLFRGL
ncbi:hypothetical protein ACKTEK_13555 [Tepidamorphus sp. 3E244]|uniref:hypothetical protein n=1 Tax=Tepidamorphus sp. 3E244 TaxID=3385498 RepID=UPI0038FC3EAA